MKFYAYLHDGKWYLYRPRGGKWCLYKPRIRIPEWFAKRISKFGYFTDDEDGETT